MTSRLTTCSAVQLYITLLSMFNQYLFTTYNDTSRIKSIILQSTQNKYPRLTRFGNILALLNWKKKYCKEQDIFSLKKLTQNIQAKDCAWEEDRPCNHADLTKAQPSSTGTIFFKNIRLDHRNGDVCHLYHFTLVGFHHFENLQILIYRWGDNVNF